MKSIRISKSRRRRSRSRQIEDFRLKICRKARAKPIMHSSLGPGFSEALVILAVVISGPYLFGPFLFYFRGSEPVLAGWRVLDETGEPIG